MLWSSDSLGKKLSSKKFEKKFYENKRCITMVEIRLVKLIMASKDQYNVQ